MTDDKEERRYGCWTFEEFVKEQEKKEHHSRAWLLREFIKLPLTPKHTDEPPYRMLKDLRCPSCGNTSIQDVACEECDKSVITDIEKIAALEVRIKELEAQLHARGCLTCDRFMVGWLSEECSKGCHAPDWKFWRARK